MSVKVQVRRSTAAGWTSANPTLASGEIGLETDTGKIKFGNGSTAWTSLAYYAAAAGTLTGSTLASGVTASSLTSVGTLLGLGVNGNIVLTDNYGGSTKRISFSELDTNHYIYSTGNGGNNTYFGEFLGGGAEGWHWVNSDTYADVMHLDGSGILHATLTGNVTGNITGSAATLATPRAINGVNFDGSAPITVTAAAGTLTGATLAANVLASSLTSVGILAGMTEISTSTAAPRTPTTGTLLHLIGADSVSARLGIDGYAGPGAIEFRHAAGTNASPTATPANTTIGNVGAKGYSAAGYPAGVKVQQLYATDEAWSDTAQGTRVTWATTLNGTTTIAERMRLDNAGRFSIGLAGAAITSPLQVVGLPVYANNAAAITGGLTAGAFYRTGANPDPVCVVH